MSTLAQHTAMVRVQLGVRVYDLPVVQLGIEMDDESVPYIVGSVTCPLGGRYELTNIDPTESAIWFDITIRRTLGRVDRIRDLTRRYRGKLLSYLSAQFDGDQVADITRSLYHDYEIPGSPRRESARTWHVVMRGTRHNERDATIEFEFASGESLLKDTATMDTNGIRLEGADLTAKVNRLLSELGAFTVTHPPAGPVPTDAQIGDEAVWRTGQTAWDAMQQLTRQHGYEVWCDGAGEFWMQTSRAAGVHPSHTLTSSGPDRSIVNNVVRRSRDDDWTTAVSIKYEGDGPTAYDQAVLSTFPPHKVKTYTYDRPNPGPGRAAAVLAKLAPLGRAQEVLAVSDYSINPADTVTTTTRRGTYRGKVAAVRWQLPEDEMSIRMRDVEEIA